METVFSRRSMNYTAQRKIRTKDLLSDKLKMDLVKRVNTHCQLKSLNQRSGSQIQLTTSM